VVYIGHVRHYYNFSWTERVRLVAGQEVETMMYTPYEAMATGILWAGCALAFAFVFSISLILYDRWTRR
jgi:hypothetical protein